MATSAEIGANAANSRNITSSRPNSVMPEYTQEEAAVQPTGQISTGGSAQFTVGGDIMSGATFQKYNHTEKLEGVQLQYANAEKQIKVVNFKQDYVVLIRKKLFYAANAASQINNPNATKDDGNYVRTYKLDTFTSVRTNNSVSGAPGTCQIELQGAERCYCFEENSTTPKGTPLIKGMVCDEWPDNYAQIAYDSNNSMGVRNMGEGNSRDKSSNSIKSGEDKESIFRGWGKNGTGELYNRDDGHSVMYNGKQATIRSRLIPYGEYGNTTYGVQSEVRIYYPEWQDQSKLSDEQKAVLEQDEYGYFVKGYQVHDSEETPQQSMWENDNISGWKIVEKCDFEPMDEVWIFGKSNFERDPDTGDFAMKQIFFGYIDTVTKNHSSGKTAGCTVSISATDQLKLLDLSYVTMNPTMTPGASMGNGGLDLRWSVQDKAHFGTFELFNPYMVAQMIGASGNAEDLTEAQKETIRASWRYLSLTNCFAGKPVCDIIKQLCTDAGVPPWYLQDRIEPIMFPPFTYMLKQANSSTLFNAVMQKRLQECVSAAQKLLLEFFADEEGNIVLKLPNYIIGANTLTKNNMGFECFDGGMLGRISIDDIQPYYAAIGADALRDRVNEDIEKNGTDAQKQAARYARRRLTKEANQFYNQQLVEKVVTANGGDYTKAHNILSGATETNGAAMLAATYRSYNPIYNTNSLGYETVKIQKGDTFYSIAERHFGTGNRWRDVYEQAKKASGLGDSLGANECEKLWDTSFQLDLNRYTNSLDENNMDIERLSSGQMYDQLKDKFWTEEVVNANGNSIQGSVTQQEIENDMRMRYDQSLSEMTDAMIPEIPQEYIISFSLVDSDKQLYNMYEVNIEGDFGIFDKGGPINKDSRVFPDLTSMIRFGCRPDPHVYSFPYMGNRENAHLLGFMLAATSVAKRKSATLSMIEDSSIKVGNPVRFFAYDEHPDTPIAPQGNHTVGATAYTMTGGNGNTATLEQNQYAMTLGQSVDAQNMAKRQAANQETEIGKAHIVTTEKKSNGVDLQGTGSNPDFAVGGGFGGGITDIGRKTTKGTLAPKDDTQSGNAKSAKSSNSNYTTIPSGGSILNHTAGTASPSKFEAPKASEVAQTTDAQSIYYVEQISRNIGASKESTMTLTLTCGRMMGKPGIMDYMMLLYKAYYDPSLGYVSDLTHIAQYQTKYKTAKEHKITANDTLPIIAMLEYPDVFTFEVDHKVNLEQKEEAVEDPFLLEKIVAGDGGYSANDEEKKLFQEAIGRGWKKLTSKITGACYKVDPDNPKQGEKLFDYAYYVYDYSRQRWSFLRTGE